jgi:4-amino-4-deoxy-L-arabinose transferase-like glycosyltransferase
LRRVLSTPKLVVALFLGSLLLNTFRIDRAPDVHGDEIMYWQAGVNVATTGRLTWLNDVPIWVHPPLYFLVEGVVASIVPVERDVFEGIATLRLVGALFGALTTVALFALVHSAFGRGAAALAAVLFLSDPFVVRICRRVMLETQMVLLVVLGLWLAYRWRDRLRAGRLALVSVPFGLALLTKEIAIVPLAALPLFAAVRRRWSLLGRSVLVMALGLVIWSAYPAWAAATGSWEEFRAAKLLGAERLAGVVPTTGWRSPPISLENAGKAALHRDLQNLPRVSLADALRKNLGQYASSYLLITLASLLGVMLCRGSRDDGPWFLASWYGATAAFLAIGALLGTVHVQFAYLILPAACAVCGAGLAPRRAGDWMRIGVTAAIVTFAVVRWVWLFGVGTDDSYRRLAQFLDDNVPAGSLVNSSQPVGIEPASRWLFPHHRLVAIRKPAELERRGVRWAILSSKDVWGGYGRMNAEYVDWLREHGKVVFRAHGNTYWDLELLELPATEVATKP